VKNRRKYFNRLRGHYTSVIASEEGRQQVTARDLRSGIQEVQQTALALTTQRDIDRQTKGTKGKPRRRRCSPDAEAPQRDCGDAAEGSAEPGEDTLADTELPARTVIPLRAVTVPA